MDRRQIDRFFKILGAEFNKEAEIILTGAAAGHIMGSKRPSMDIDFAIKLKKAGKPGWEELESAIRKAIAETGIQVNYAEDIDKWGMITLLDYENNTKFYKKYGNLTLRVLSPAFWSIGKVTRFLDPDIKDMIQVFRKTKLSPIKLAKVWGRALRESPRSMVLTRFRRQVESFFDSYGKRIWGSSFNSTKAIRQFHKSADIEK
ncbi:MAG TPA: hypothetical protein ENH31_06185 [Nitrospirae bacterium]|nr:hypothetical protein BMS3Abin10_00111 [bacterium BMS3Abin10]GBE39296.1 hypothetical protein BMS3Bbin08_01918 [bacterium BMS3Bbin08]HDK17196.1 hypothetical protein [Nitrospirota bacterium]HDK82145.1 hypothetical protein [Nitrospirota bacterium]